MNDISPVDGVIVVDDCCAENSGDLVQTSITDAKATVIKNEFNQSVGGSVLNKFSYAIKQGVEILLKIDGDGQMDVRLGIGF